MVIPRDEYLVTTARDLGAAMKHFRTMADVTQVDSAEAMGIGQPYLSSLESGKFGSSLTHALRLVRFVGCEVVVRPRVPRVLPAGSGVVQRAVSSLAAAGGRRSSQSQNVRRVRSPRTTRLPCRKLPDAVISSRTWVPGSRRTRWWMLP
jgi:DNA-binding XRE family transcriptional regulator